MVHATVAVVVEEVVVAVVASGGHASQAVWGHAVPEQGDKIRGLVQK